jgi:undecaprenyl diphosphate synthase
MASKSARAAEETQTKPRHVAIIMDGNGRWAKARFLPRLAGHKQGVEAVRRVSRAARTLGIEVLTLYAFSSENWRRPEAEVSDLMGLLRHFLASELDELVSEGVKLRVIGDWRRLAPDLVGMIDRAVARTVGNPGPTLVIALNYGAQAEIAAAARALAEAARDGTLDPAVIDEDRFAEALETHDLPPLDLMIRTSGEQRLSNFLLWQAAYAELLFVDTLWPDFDATTLADALGQYARRQRRFGGL